MSSVQSTSTAQIFIPYVRDAPHGQDTAEFVAKTLEASLQAPGSVHRVDLKPTKDGRANMAFVHFHSIPETNAATHLFEKLKSGTETRLFYSAKWYWKIVGYKKTESTEDFTPRLEFDTPTESGTASVSEGSSASDGDDGCFTVTECNVWLKGNKIVSEDGFETPISPLMSKKMCAWLNDCNNEAPEKAPTRGEAFKMARDSVMWSATRFAEEHGRWAHGGECAASQG